MSQSCTGTTRNIQGHEVGRSQRCVVPIPIWVLLFLSWPKHCGELPSSVRPSALANPRYVESVNPSTGMLGFLGANLEDAHRKKSKALMT